MAFITSPAAGRRPELDATGCRRSSSRHGLRPLQYRSTSCDFQNIGSIGSSSASSTSSTLLQADIRGMSADITSSALTFPPADAVATSATVATDQAATVFEPTLPSTTALIGMSSVVVLSIIAGLVWANGVVPVSRTKLAISKSRGEVKEYLDGLRVEEEEGIGEDAEESEQAVDSAGNSIVKPNVGDGRDVERWLFSDWLNSGSTGGKPGRKKEPALPVLKNAKWNSGDNPVLVASALIGLCVLVASVAERFGGAIRIM